MFEAPTVLTIAGSDSSGGAGIQADIKTFCMLGTYGASVITALTAQNTLGVAGISAPEADFVALQLRQVLEDLDIRAAKTGMLFSAEIIEAIAPLLRDAAIPLVVDPVCVATSGDALLKPDAVDALKSEIFPLATLLTPNRHEAEYLSGVKIESREDCFRAIEKLLEMGAQAVLLKGGHFDEFAAVTDWLGFPGEEPLPMIQPKVDTENLHGTGCTLSAAIAAGLGKGGDVIQAVASAQRYLNLGLRASFPVGEGAGPVNHMAPLFQGQAGTLLLEELYETSRLFAALPGARRLVPERGANVAFAVPYASGPESVIAFDGTMQAALDGHVMVPGQPRLGADERLSSALLAAWEMTGRTLCAAVVSAADEVLDAAVKAELAVCDVSRNREKDAEEVLRDGLDWGVFDALREREGDIDAAVETGVSGREPLLFVFAEDGGELVAKLERIISELQ